MNKLALALHLTFLAAISAYTVEVAVSLNLPALTGAQHSQFVAAVATTAEVSEDKVHVVQVDPLNATYIQVEFQVVTADYMEAGLAGIRLQQPYVDGDLHAQGLPSATILSGPSFEGSDHDTLACTGCERGQYLDAVCRDCPPNSDTPPRVIASDINACVCMPGYTSNGVICEPCGSEGYKAHLGNESCTTCPANSSAVVENATAITQCRCNVGFVQEAGVCVETLCEPGHVASANNNCVACEPGKFQSYYDVSICVECGPGTYNEQHAAHSVAECIQCPEFTTSAAGSRSAHECVCQAGYATSGSTLDPARSCHACPPGFFQQYANSSECSACGPGTYSVATAATTDLCSECADGQFNVEPGQSECFLCSAGTWQNTSRVDAKSNTCELCPAHSNHSNLGVVDVHDCLCKPGYYKVPEGGLFQCQLCASGEYCTGDNLRRSCTENSESLEGSDDPSDCTCSGGYYGPNGGVCELCASGSFCPGGEYSQLCRAHANSSAGATSESECTCKPGWYSPELACVKCPPGSYCSGGSEISSCAANSMSPPGSSQILACSCEEGMWRGCILTSGGETVDADGSPCVIDYTLACWECGESQICANNSLLHCPEHSVAPAGSHDPGACRCEDGFYNVAI